jgi:hypothetical protein
MPTRLLAVMAGLSAALPASLGTSGCARQLVIEEADNKPTTTIGYSGVRSGSRRFADYGSIDASILASGKKPR